MYRKLLRKLLKQVLYTITQHSTNNESCNHVSCGHHKKCCARVRQRPICAIKCYCVSNKTKSVKTAVGRHRDENHNSHAYQRSTKSKYSTSMINVVQNMN